MLLAARADRGALLGRDFLGSPEALAAPRHRPSVVVARVHLELDAVVAERLDVLQRAVQRVDGVPGAHAGADGDLHVANLLRHEGYPSVARDLASQLVRIEEAASAAAP